ncbi:hypothetical protein CP533_4349 [Ophiocordyceps camponoti-saundersi (nom. inval.)]|nr:hypothetical protein CP533_4349 [Ophiocordyceps camponoti-saundersi (nom. inval.)]
MSAKVNHVNGDAGPEPLAIVGMAMRLPGGVRNEDDFWRLLVEKRHGLCQVPKSRFNIQGFHDAEGRPGTLPMTKGYFLQDVDFDQVDLSFSSLRRKEMQFLDPQIRLLLEVTYECMENAGVTSWQGSNVGCYVGAFFSEWERALLEDEQRTSEYQLLGSDPMMLANRISYQYDLHGPSVTVKTGCSSSLVCLDMACSSIRKGDCDGALVCGTNIMLSPASTSILSITGALSSYGACRTFDASAQGYGRGEAINAIYVKTLRQAIKDNDPIRAVIRGTATGCDGLTPTNSTPNSEQQSALIRSTYQQAGLRDLSKTAIVECHGTGTQVGDIAETKAVASCFGEKGIVITSVSMSTFLPSPRRKLIMPVQVKPNIGHGEGAAGITSIIKAVLTLEHQKVPPNIFFETPNTKIPFEKSNLHVPVETEDWPEDRAERISINGFGVGGTNAHVILESLHQYHTGKPANAHVNGDDKTEPGDDDHHLLLFSAHNEASVTGSVGRHRQHLEAGSASSLKDVAYTLAHRRDHKTHRTYAVVDSNSLSLEAPSPIAADSTPAVGWIFTGQGAQWPGMAAELLDSNPVFRQTIERLDRFLAGLPTPPSWTIRDELGKAASDSRVGAAELSPPLCAALQIGLVDVLRSWDVRPDFVLGHSIGEIAAAYASSAFTAEAAMAIAYFRGLSLPAREGSMAAVGLGSDETATFLGPGVVVACENSQESVTISGDTDRVEEALGRIKEKRPGVFSRPLNVKRAFHSEHMNEKASSYEKSLKPYVVVESDSVKIPYYSSVYAERLLDGQRLGPSYWRDNLQKPVLFNKALRSALSGRDKNCLLVEIGPHPSLRGPMIQILRDMGRTDDVCLGSLIRGQDCRTSLLGLAGKMFQHKVDLDLLAVCPAGTFTRKLPPYHWTREQVPLAEPRASRELRNREYPPHELLGVRVFDLSDEPVWRNRLATERMPWLLGHKVENQVVFPAAAFVCVVGEALRQLDGHPGFELRNVRFLKAMMLTQDRDLELVTRLRSPTSTVSGWRDFAISSFDGRKWTIRCTGEARPLDKASACPRADQVPNLPRRVSEDYWAMRSISAGTMEGSAVATVPSYGGYILHPATLDNVLQLFSVIMARGLGRNLGDLELPAVADRIVIRPVDPGQDLTVVGRQVQVNGRKACTLVAQQGGRQLLHLENIQCFAIPGTNASPEDSMLFSHLEWRPHADLADLGSLLPEVRSSDCDDPRLRELVLLYCIDHIDRMKPADFWLPHVSKHLDWMKRFAKRNEPTNQSLFRLTRRERASRIGALVSDERSTTNLFKAVNAVFTASLAATTKAPMKPLEVLLRDNLLGNLYDDLLSQCNVSPVIQVISHTNPNLKILEVGGGTGSLTKSCLDALHSRGEQFYGSYTFTDISHGFLASAKKRFRAHSRLDFKILDLETDPVEQGFVLDSYDLVVASDVVHATTNLQASLTRLRRLLKPTGRLLMIDQCDEGTIPVTYIFGFFPGWWLGEADGRVHHPMVSKERWCKEMRLAGFEEPNVVSLKSHAMFVASCAREPSQAQSTRVSLVCHAHDGPLVEEMKASLSSLGIACDVCPFGASLPSDGQSIVCLLDLDDRREPLVHDMDATAFETLFGYLRGVKDKTIWLTRPCQYDCQDPRYSMILGLARTFRRELSQSFYTVEVDQAHGSIASSIDLVARLLQDTGGTLLDVEYAVSRGQVHVPRMIRQTTSDAFAETRDKTGLSTVRLTKRSASSSDPLEWVETGLDRPGHGEVLIQVKAMSLNFKDVMHWSGLIEMPQNFTLGFDCSGVVVEVGPGVESTLSVGDRVMCMTVGAFASFLTASEESCCKLDDGMTFEQAASVPTIYTTVVEALVELARLKRGQSVLIHSACGGVGLAAIEVARMLGGEIYCTTGSDKKRRYLTDQVGIPPSRIFSSRDASFARDLMQSTGGTGVDVVLNSLSGELLQASWACVAAGGTMVELGKTDILGRASLPMMPFAESRTFTSMDGQALMTKHKCWAGSLLKRTMGWMRSGHLKPPPVTKLWEADQMLEALGDLRRGQHIGKMVVRMPDDASGLASAWQRPQRRMRPDRCYLIVGGLGGIGRAVASWFVEKGARHLIFLSPSARSSPEVDSFLDELTSQGCQSQLIEGSVCELDDVERAVKTAARPIAGVVNLAMRIKSTSLDSMKLADWTVAVKPKVLGTWNIDKALSSAELDFFVLTSSINGYVGYPGEASYNAASTFQDSFVQYRQRKGLVASVVDVGMVGDNGYVARNRSLVDAFRRFGLRELDERHVLDAIDLAIQRSRPAPTTACRLTVPSHIMLGLVGSRFTASENDVRLHAWRNKESTGGECQDGEAPKDKLDMLLASAREQPSALEGEAAAAVFTTSVIASFATVVGRDAGAIDAGQSPVALGLDSLLVVEMRSNIWRKFGVRLPTVTLRESPTFTDLAEVVRLAVVERLTTKGG